MNIKTIRNLLFVSVLCTISLRVCSQSDIDFDRYTSLKSSGKLPEDITKLSIDKYKEELAKIKEKDLSRSERKLEQKFQLDANYSIDRMLLSGKVLCNDPLSQYVAKVAKEIMKDDLETYEKLRFYTVRYTRVNAFTTPSGIIFVNIGLLAQLENEAQLAYILCHEITHFKKQHSLLGFKFENKLEKKISKSNYRNSGQDNFLTKCAFNKEQEVEADEEGFMLYKKSGYSLKALDGVFDVLQFANLPFDEVSFNKRFFEDNVLKFPADFQLVDSLLKPVGQDDDEDDEESTHPSIRKRRKLVENMLEGLNNKDRKNYIVSKTDFELTRKIARFELLHLYLLNHDYEYALYSAFILSEADSNNYYINKTIVKSLYALTKISAKEGESGFKEIHTDYEKVEGASGSLYYLIEKLHEEPIALNVLALKRAWKLKMKHPEDEELDKITTELFMLLIKENKASFTDFEEYKTDDKTTTVDEKKTEEDEPVKKSKYNKIKKAKKESSTKAGYNKSFIYAGMVDLVKDPEFRKAFKKAENVVLSVTKKEDKETKFNKKKKNEDEDEKTAEASEPINKVIVSEPFYYKVDLRKKEAFKQEESERALVNLDEKISRLSEKADVKAVRYNSKTLTADDVDVLNNIMLINDYLRDNNENEESNLIKVDYKEIAKLIDQNNTPYLMNMGIIYAIEDKQDMIVHFGLCFGTCGLYTPILIYQLLKVNVVTYIMSETIDLRTGKYVYNSIKKVNSRDKDYVIEMHLYDMLLQLKHNNIQD